MNPEAYILAQTLLVLMQKKSSDTLEHRSILSGLKFYCNGDTKIEREKKLTILSKTLNKKILNDVDKLEQRNKCISLLEDLEVPLAVNEIHYLLAGIKAVDKAIYHRISDLMKLCNVFINVTVRAASYAIQDGQYDTNIIIDNTIDSLKDSKTFTEQYDIFEALIYQTLGNFMLDKALKVDNLKEFFNIEEIALILSDISNSKYKNKLTVKKIELINNFIIGTLQMYKHILLNTEYTEMLKNMISKNSTNDSQNNTLLVQKLYTMRSMSGIRNKLAELNVPLSDSIIKMVAAELPRIAKQERALDRVNTTINSTVMRITA